MERKTTIVLALTGIILAAFVVVLGENLLSEEVLLLFLIPFTPACILLGLSILVARIRGRRISIEQRIRRILIAGSAFHCLVIAFVLYATWPRYYDRAEAVEDIDAFVQVLEDVHPHLYDRISRNVFADSVEGLKRRISGSVGEHDLFKGISRLGALIQDGHTGNGYSYFMRRGNLFLRKMFPYKLRVEDDRIFIIGNYSYKDDVPEGSEILRINGVAAAAFIGQIGSLLSYETIPYRNTLIANPMFIAIWNDFKDYDLEIQLPVSGGVKNVNTYGGIYARVQFVRSLTAMRQPYEFSVIKDSIGYIGFYQCADLNRFTGFLAETFQEVKSAGIRHLVVDIRENGGGNSALADEFMQYISRKPFRMSDRVQIKVSKEVLSWHPERLDPAWREAGKIYETSDLPLTALRPNPLRFEGDCILLTGRHTFSSAVMFASAFQCCDVGAIVGAETGGITVCYGDVYDFTLPHTNFGFGVSWKKFTNACGIDNRRGVFPDYPVENSFSDEQSGRDGVLEFAVEMIRRNGARGGSSTL